MVTLLGLSVCISSTVVDALSTNKLSYKAEWIHLDLEPHQRISPRRSGAVPIPTDPKGSRRYPLVFGGYAEVDNTSIDSDNDSSSKQPFHRYVVNDLWEWKNNAWNKVETANDDSSSDMPAPRLVGAAAVVNEAAYLFGGWNSDDPNNMFLDSIHKLKLDVSQEVALRWEELATRIPDGPVSRHVAVALKSTNKKKNGKILVHTHRCQDYVWLFDATTETFTKQPTTGPCPSARGLHAACSAPARGGGVIVFGGASQDGTMSNQVFRLDIETWEWQELFAGGDSTSASAAGKTCPTPRAGPCLCTVNGGDGVIMYGGAEAVDGGLKPHGDVWLFDLENLEWTCLLPSTAVGAPPPRNAAVLFGLPQGPGKEDEQGSISDFLMAAGWAPFRETWDDTYILRVSKN
eukprot:scaffold3402_cov169-Amphora_coffeaeformis.AAC.4